MISSFSLCIGLGAGLGMAWVSWRAPKEKAGSWLNAGLLVLIGALVGARAGFVLSHPAYYQAHWLEVFQVWLGGLSWPGALVGFVVSLGLFSFITRTQLGPLADGLLPLALPLLVGIWLGSWLSGVAYGQAVSGPWWVIPAPDEWGEWSPRVPVQVLGGLMTILIFMLVDWIRPNLKRSGQAASLVLFGIALLMLGLSGLRADPVQVWRGWRLDTLAAAVFTGFSLLVNITAFWPLSSGIKALNHEKHELHEKSIND